MTLEQAQDIGREYTFGNESVFVFSNNFIKLGCEKKDAEEYAKEHGVELFQIKPEPSNKPDKKLK